MLSTLETMKRRLKNMFLSLNTMFQSLTASRQGVKTMLRPFVLPCSTMES
jgi:hypothetical protein